LKGKRKEAFVRSALFLGAELSLFALGFVVSAFLFGWRSPQNVSAWAFIAWAFVNLLVVLTYVFTRQILDYPLEKWFRIMFCNQTAREDFHEILRQAHSLERAGKVSEAYVEFRKAIALEPLKGDLLFEVATFCERHFEKRVALNYYKKILELGKAHSPANVLLITQDRVAEIEILLKS
jgi:tetratricopeptide (TPR) repeat protein